MLALAARVQASERALLRLDRMRALLDDRRAALRARLAAEERPAMRLVAVLQRLSRRPPALALVDQRSLVEAGQVRAVLATMLPRLAQRTAGLRARLAEVNRLTVQSRALADTHRRLMARLDDERRLLSRSADRARAEATGFRTRAMVEEDRMLAAAERARSVEGLVAEVAATSAVSARLATLPGPVPRPGQSVSAVKLGRDPVAGWRYRLPVVGTIVKGFGELRPDGSRSKGLRIATSAGALVVAPGRGRVAFAGPYRSFGSIVILDHGRGWTSLVTGLAETTVRVGDLVDPGYPIGRAGPAPATIDVELRRDETPVDIVRLVR